MLNAITVYLELTGFGPFGNSTPNKQLRKGELVNERVTMLHPSSVTDEGARKPTVLRADTVEELVEKGFTFTEEDIKAADVKKEDRTGPGFRTKEEIADEKEAIEEAQAKVIIAKREAADRHEAILAKAHPEAKTRAEARAEAKEAKAAAAVAVEERPTPPDPFAPSDTGNW